MRNRPLPTIKRINEMRERRKESNDFHAYIMEIMKDEKRQERVLIERFVDDEQIEKTLCEDDF